MAKSWRVRRHSRVRGAWSLRKADFSQQVTKPWITAHGVEGRPKFQGGHERGVFRIGSLEPLERVIFPAEHGIDKGHGPRAYLFSVREQQRRCQVAFCLRSFPHTCVQIGALAKIDSFFFE